MLTNLIFSTAFIFNLAISIILYILLYLLAPFIANFYNTLELEKIIKILGVTIIINAIQSVQIALLSRNMEFKKMFFATIIGTIISAIIGMIMAYSGFGVWALIYQNITKSIVNIFALFCVIDWYPKMYFSYE